MLGIPKHEELGDACSRMDLTAIQQILVMTHYKDDEGTNELSFQEWTQQRRDMLEARKSGDLAFRDKHFRTAIDCYSQESPEGNQMLQTRMSLPSFREKERLLQAIALNQVIIISGETGCGKTTQLPQYILESEIESGRGAFCNILCTQPRRISAMAVAERVSTERGEPLGESVGKIHTYFYVQVEFCFEGC